MAVVLFAASGALAQSFFAIVGSLESLAADSVSVRTEAGATETETFKLSPAYLVLQNRPATLHDIQPNDFVASAAVRKADGKLHSTEVRIFPEAMRGVGEGQRPMGDAAQTMTNATVTGTAIVAGSNTLKVKFAGGESELVVNPGVPVTAITAVDRSLLKPGAKVRVQGTKGPDGVLIQRITLL
jgi:hypothetical protein